MTKIKITYDRKLCIGAAACVAMDPKYFEMVDGKAVLKGGKLIDKERYELEITKNEESYHAAESCPVEAIKIQELVPEEDKETKVEKLTEKDGDKQETKD